MARSKKVNNLKESKPQQEEGVHHRGTTKATNSDIKKSPEKQRIGNYDECPSYVQQGNHLDTGYRLGYTKKRQFLFSIFQIHNETLNIWTHMIGGFIFIGIIVYVALAFAGASLDHVKQAFAYRVDPELLMNSIRSQITETVSSLEGLKYTLEEQSIELESFELNREDILNSSGSESLNNYLEQIKEKLGVSAHFKDLIDQFDQKYNSAYETAVQLYPKF